jgi:hypothetical protein
MRCNENFCTAQKYRCAITFGLSTRFLSHFEKSAGDVAARAENQEPGRVVVMAARVTV